MGAVRAVSAPFQGLWVVNGVSQGVALGYGWGALSVLGIQQRGPVATLAVGPNSTTYSFLAN